MDAVVDKELLEVASASCFCFLMLSTTRKMLLYSPALLATFVCKPIAGRCR